MLIYISYPEYIICVLYNNTTFQEHPWTTAGNQYPLPTEEENCVLIEVTDEEVNSSVRSIPKLDTLILIKSMLKKHSFQNPFKMERSNSAPGSYEFYFERYGLRC